MHCPAKKLGADNDKDEGDQLHTMQAIESNVLDDSGGKKRWSDSVEDLDGGNENCYFFCQKGMKGLN